MKNSGFSLLERALQQAQQGLTMHVGMPYPQEKRHAMVAVMVTLVLQVLSVMRCFARYNILPTLI